MNARTAAVYYHDNRAELVVHYTIRLTDGSEYSDERTFTATGPTREVAADAVVAAAHEWVDGERFSAVRVTAYDDAGNSY